MCCQSQAFAHHYSSSCLLLNYEMGLSMTLKYTHWWIFFHLLTSTFYLGGYWVFMVCALKPCLVWTSPTGHTQGKPQWLWAAIKRMENFRYCLRGKDVVCHWTLPGHVPPCSHHCQTLQLLPPCPEMSFLWPPSLRGRALALQKLQDIPYETVGTWGRIGGSLRGTSWRWQFSRITEDCSKSSKESMAELRTRCYGFPQPYFLPSQLCCHYSAGPANAQLLWVTRNEDLFWLQHSLSRSQWYWTSYSVLITLKWTQQT